MVLSRIRLKNSALLVIDVINSCCSSKCESREPKITFKKIRKMVPELVAFIKKYKECSENPVIYINCTQWDKEHLAANISELYKDPNCRYYSKDKTGFRNTFYKVKPDSCDIIVTKNGYDAFTNPELDRLLKKRQIRYLIVAGVFGDGCVHSTIQSGFSKGYNFIILKDLIETTNVKIRQNLQKLLKSYTWPVMFGKTISSEEFLNRSSNHS
ncbi:MAG: isochorismatase family cysteine hydrolase [Nanoarchaeota archaeon]